MNYPKDLSYEPLPLSVNKMSKALIRSSLINSNEHRLLSIVASFNNLCFLSVYEIAYIMKTTEKTTRRVIKSLVERGRLDKYRKKLMRYSKWKAPKLSAKVLGVKLCQSTN